MFRFPYDTQICYLEFGNVIESDLTVNVSVYPDTADFISEFYSPSNEFNLNKVQANRTAVQVCQMESKHTTTKGVDGTVIAWIPVISVSLLYHYHDFP